MTKKRLTRELKWGFQFFPYYQLWMESELFTGWVAINYLTDGEYYYWNEPKAGRVPVAGKGMCWLTLIPKEKSRSITAMFTKDRHVSVWYVDVIDGVVIDEDGVVAFMDKYLDVIFTPQGDIRIDDRDELDAAFYSGELSKEQYEKALAEGDEIIKELCNDIEATENWCSEILQKAEEIVCQNPFTVLGRNVMTYESAKTEDLQAVYDVVQCTIKTIYPNYYPSEVVEFFCGLHSREAILHDIQNGCVGVLRIDGKIVATGCFVDNHITRVYVLPECQKKGYGTFIMNHIEAQICVNHDKACLDASLPAAVLYEKLGYSKVKHERYPVENGVVLAYEIMEKELHKPEIWDLYNENRELLGRDHVRGEQLPTGCYHLVVQVWIRNSRGEYLISQRSANRPTYPLMWESVGGSVVKGEDSLSGALREAKEEVGVDLLPENGRLLFTKTREIIGGKIYNDILDVWLFEYDGAVDLANATTDEVAQAAWMNREQIRELFEQKKFVSSLEYFFTEVDYGTD